MKYSEKILKLAEAALRASEKEEKSCNEEGRPGRYEKAAASRAYTRFLKACDSEGLTNKEVITCLHSLKFPNGING